MAKKKKVSAAAAEAKLFRLLDEMRKLDPVGTKKFLKLLLAEAKASKAVEDFINQ